MGLSTLKKALYSKFQGTGTKYRPTEYPDAAITDADSGLILPAHLAAGDSMPASPQKYHRALHTGDSGYTTRRGQWYFVDPSRTASGDGVGAQGVWLSDWITTYTFMVPYRQSASRASAILSFSAPPANGATVTISPRTYTASTTSPPPGSNQFYAGASATEAATNLAGLINNGVGTSDYTQGLYGRHQLASATASGGDVTVTSNETGAAGNAISLNASTSPALNATWSVGNTFLAGGTPAVSSGSWLYLPSGIQSSATVGYYDDQIRRLVRWRIWDPGASSGQFTVYSGATLVKALAWTASGIKANRNVDQRIPAGLLNVKITANSASPGCILELDCVHEEAVT